MWLKAIVIINISDRESYFDLWKKMLKGDDQES